MALIQKMASGSTCRHLELSGEPATPPLRALASGGQATVTELAPDTGGAYPAEFSHYIVPGTGGHGRARSDALLSVVTAFACRVTVFHYDATRHDKFLIMAGVRPVLDALDVLLPKI